MDYARIPYWSLAALFDTTLLPFLTLPVGNCAGGPHLPAGLH